MKTIWKKELPINHDIRVKIPIGADILSLKVQKDVPCIWFQCESEADTETRIFDFFGTGHAIPDNYNGYFIGTVLSPDQLFVYHLFERI